MSLKEFADTLPDYAKDLRLNLGSLLNDQLLGEYPRPTTADVGAAVLAAARAAEATSWRPLSS